MSRIKNCFDALRARKCQALIPYITAGDPNPSVTVPLMHAMVKAGANILELGVPFSDPMAEGPIIQQACERALKHHVSLRQVLDMVREFRTRDVHTPVILMGYLNPIEVMGYAEFARAARAADVDGVITVDLPPEEAEGFVTELRTQQLDTVFLVAPTSSTERIAKICAMASGFVYYVSLKGVTGAAGLDVASVMAKVREIRAATDLPIGVGFGIKDAATAAQIAAVADAVVVGSALVRKLGEFAEQPHKIEQEVVSILSQMRAAMDAR